MGMAIEKIEIANEKVERVLHGTAEEKVRFVFHTIEWSNPPDGDVGPVGVGSTGGDMFG